MDRKEIKKKHYYLPRFYLPGFTKAESNSLWVYEKGRLEIRPSSPEAEGCQKFYHAFVTEEGKAIISGYRIFTIMQLLTD